MTVLRQAVVWLGLLGMTSCVNPGQPAPTATLNFPIAIALSPSLSGAAPTHLLVANSNFTLRYNQGSLQAYDLEAIHARLGSCNATTATPCGIGDSDQDPLTNYLASEVAIGTHADGLAFNAEGTRAYIASRGDRDLTYVDFEPASGQLSCGQTANQSGEIAECTERFLQADVGERALALDADPVDVISGTLDSLSPGQAGNYVLMALRTGQIALYLDGVDASGNPALDTAPRLIHIADGFADNLVTLTMNPLTQIAWATSSSTNRLGRAAIVVNPNNLDLSFVYGAGEVDVSGLDDGNDTREIQFHPNRPRAFVLSRRPESIIGLDVSMTTGASPDLYIWRIMEVANGPSRIVTATVGDQVYLFVSCYDAKQIFVIDADHGALVSVIGGLSGPFEMVVDAERNFLYVTDFNVSMLRLVDLSPLLSNESPQLVGNVGIASPFQSLTGT